MKLSPQEKRFLETDEKPKKRRKTAKRSIARLRLSEINRMILRELHSIDRRLAVLEGAENAKSGASRAIVPYGSPGG